MTRDFCRTVAREASAFNASRLAAGHFLLPQFLDEFPDYDISRFEIILACNLGLVGIVHPVLPALGRSAARAYCIDRDDLGAVGACDEGDVTGACHKVQ